MPLFLVQDDDRPMYVIEESWEHALAKWRAFVAWENKLIGDHALAMEGPQGIQLICGDEDLLIGNISTDMLMKFNSP